MRIPMLLIAALIFSCTPKDEHLVKGLTRVDCQMISELLAAPIRLGKEIKSGKEITILEKKQLKRIENRIEVLVRDERNYIEDTKLQCTLYYESGDTLVLYSNGFQILMSNRVYINDNVLNSLLRSQE